MNYAEADKQKHLTILGGGPAGLATAWYAQKAELPFNIYEASGELGGNSRTFKWGAFLLDTGAHRLHDKQPEITAAFRELLGDVMQEVETPSQIFQGGQFYDFPLSPLDVVRKMSMRDMGWVVLENLYRLVSTSSKANNFREYAIQRYGPTLANRFLLNYSGKLWGRPTERLSPNIAGSRIKRLDIKTFLLEWLRGAQSKTRHLDGRFYYPKYGIGMLTDRLIERSDKEKLHTESKITRLIHDGSRINNIEINDETMVNVEELISTLPLPLMVQLLTPEPPEELKRKAGGIQFRNLRLVVFNLNRERFSSNASIYFPDSDIPFTRIYESKNRSAAMAPACQTAIAIEIPCDKGTFYCDGEDEKVIEEVKKELTRHTSIKGEEVLDATSYHIPLAYPVLETGIESTLEQLKTYLAGFENLHLVGRNARFQYAHLHDMFAMARETVSHLAGDEV